MKFDDAFETSAEANNHDEAPATKVYNQGLRFHRHFTTAGVHPFDAIKWERRTSVIMNPDGSVVFRADDVEVPTSWSQLATDIAVSKYFRKAGVNGGAETSARQLISRVAKTIRESGEEQGGYFASSEDADVFEAELTHILINQYGAFNSPVWFNVGLWHQYGITGAGQSYAWVEGDGGGRVERIGNSYSRPQSSACFIQSVDDSLESIMRLMTDEVMLFKYGSGTGTNFSNLRGEKEKLSGGGYSSGLMSFLEMYDRAAGAIKSGGTTRRAAKLVCLDMDHPDIVRFIQWKVKEERKAKALITAGYPSDFNGEAYATVSGQNSNNSVRVTDEFMTAVGAGGEWATTYRTTKEVASTHEARELWRMIAECAWECADPGILYDTTINRWHTVPASGRINACNPCAEYHHLDDTACNLASLNLTKFLRPDNTFDVYTFRYAIRVFFVAQEILVDLASYPTNPIAKNSHDFRPLGIGYANLGTLLMLQGLPYDSDEGRAMAGAITAIMTGHAYRVSAEMARHKGPFNGFAKNRVPMLNVMAMHAQAAIELPKLQHDYLREAAVEDWRGVVERGVAYGFRNAQASVLAPTGTIGFLMDCDTTGIEPDFALVKFKKLAGGGYFKIVNGAVASALRERGYTRSQIDDITTYVVGTKLLDSGTKIDRRALLHAGLLESELDAVEAACVGALELESCFAPWVIGDEAYERLGVTKGQPMLRALGFTADEIAKAEDVILGRQTIEGAPHLHEAHLPIFDCANRCGKYGTRYIEPMAHLRMMAAAQPFLSGAISKTINVPTEATVEDIAGLYEAGWRLGLKAVALYRDGCKASQPLSSGSKKEGVDVSKSESSAPEKTLAQCIENTLTQIMRAVVHEPAKADELVPPFIAQMSEPYRKELRGAVACMSSLIHGLEQLKNAPALIEELPTNHATPPLSPTHIARLRLPTRRFGITQEAIVGGHKMFVRTGEYADGRCGEIFIDMHKEGAAFRSLMNCLAIAVSLGLQHGIPLETFVDQFVFTRFEPQGSVQHDPNVKMATSVVDYIFRFLGVNYLQRHDLAHVKPEVGVEATPAVAARKQDQRAAASIDVKEIGQHFETMALVAERGKKGADALSAHLDEMMGDAPLCDTCGHMTVRNGSCYRCLNCGSSMGCS